MKVKNLRDLLYKLNDDEEVVLLNDAAPITATNEITSALIVQEPVTPKSNTFLESDKDADADKTYKSRLVLTYSTRERSETK